MDTGLPDDVKYELRPDDSSVRINSLLIAKKRILIGRSDSCDIAINHPEISAIHAVMEVDGDGNGVIYDMNSKNGTFVGTERVVSKKVKIGDKISLGRFPFSFDHYEEDHLPPPILDVLQAGPPPIIDEKSTPHISVGERLKIDQDISKSILDSPLGKPSNLPKTKPKIDSSKQPLRPIAVKTTKEAIPSIVYPLAADPKAEFSEYIFEDIDDLYPIFKYDTSTAGVEVIIVFKDRIYSVDYLPTETGTYYMKGLKKNPQESSIEYPFLEKSEKFPLITIEGGHISIQQPTGYDVLFIGDNENKEIKSKSGFLYLKNQEIIRLGKENHQIYIRNTDSPPSVKAAPTFRRDKDLKKYLLLMLFFVFSFLAFLFVYQVDEDLEREKVPEKIRTIIYKKNYRPKIVASKNKAIAKTKKAPKKIQKSPKQKVPPKKPEQKKPTTEKKVTPKKVPKNVGSKTAKKVQKVKKTKKAAPVKTKTAAKKPRPSKAPKRGGRPGKTQARKAKINSKNQGKVDAYKSSTLKSTISAMMAKGGSTSGVSAKSGDTGSPGITDLATGGEQVGEVQRAKVSNNVGSLTGSATGKLDTTKGAQGIVNKRQVYVAGIPSSTVVLGSMDPDIIRKILRDHIRLFRGCYQKELDRSSREFSGVINLSFTIGASGNVSKAGLAGETKLPSNVKSCVINILRGIQFPAPLGGGTVDVRQPINFYPNVR